MSTYFYTEGAVYTSLNDAKESIKNMPCAKITKFNSDDVYEVVSDVVENHEDHDYCSVMDAIRSFDFYPEQA